MSAERDAVVDALVAERYGRPLWWETPAPEPDTLVATAERRRRMAADFDQADHDQADAS